VLGVQKFWVVARSGCNLVGRIQCGWYEVDASGVGYGEPEGLREMPRTRTRLGRLLACSRGYRVSMYSIDRRNVAVRIRGLSNLQVNHIRAIIGGFTVWWAMRPCRRA